MYINVDRVIAVLLGFLIAAFFIGSGIHILDFFRFDSLFPFTEYAESSPVFALAWSCFWVIAILGALKLLLRRNKS